MSSREPNIIAWRIDTVKKRAGPVHRDQARVRFLLCLDNSKFSTEARPERARWLRSRSLGQCAKFTFMRSTSHLRHGLVEVPLRSIRAAPRAPSCRQTLLDKHVQLSAWLTQCASVDARAVIRVVDRYGTARCQSLPGARGASRSYLPMSAPSRRLHVRGRGAPRCTKAALSPMKSVQSIMGAVQRRCARVGSVALDKRIDERHAQTGEVRLIARDQRESVGEGGRSNLFVDGALRMRDAVCPSA